MQVRFVDQTLRDGQQSLWGMRMRACEAGPALEDIARTGFHVVDLTGATMFTVLLREFKDDPWATLDYMVAGLAGNDIRAGNRTVSVGAMTFTPDSVIDLWVKTLVRHGITSFWFFDCLYDLPKMRRIVEVAQEAGVNALPALMYGLTDVHDDAFFADQIREMASWPGVTDIYVEDAPGVLTPERAQTLLPALQAAAPDTQLELHCHNTTGLAPLLYLVGLENGIDILHTASRPMANGPSLPSTEVMLENLRVAGHTHGLDESRLLPVAEHFERAAIAAGYPVGTVNEYSLLPYQHQLPGGMTGTLKAQLAQNGMEDRLDEVLDEIPRVRVDLGQPIMATPFSQFVGIQAVLNVVTGERYKLVPDQVIQYTLGHYGPLPRAVDPEVADRILGTPRAASFADWERPQPTLGDLRERFGRSISDEELLIRVLNSNEAVDAMLAAGPLRTDPRTSAQEILENVIELMAESKVAQVSISQPGFSLNLGRNGS